MSIARKAKLLGFSVTGFDPNYSKIKPFDTTITKLYNLEYFLRSSDCVSICLETSNVNIESINSRVFSRMKSGRRVFI